MKRTLHLLLILLVFCVSAQATQVTVAALTPGQPWQSTITAVRLRIFLNKAVTTSDQRILQSGSPSSGLFYQSITCTVVGGNLQIPQFTIDSLTDALVGNDAKYSAYFYSSAGAQIAPYQGFTSFTVGPVLAQTWSSILQFNNAYIPFRPQFTYDTQTIDLKIQTAISGAPGNATYITQTPNDDLTNEFAISSLGAGLLKHMGSGSLVVASAGTDYETGLTFNAPLSRSVNAISLIGTYVNSFNARTGAVSLTSGDVTTALGYTPQDLALKNAANGYAGLTSGTKLNASQGQEVWAPADLTGVSGVQGSGSTLPIGTFSSLVDGQGIVWNAAGSNFINAAIGTVKSVAVAVPSWLSVSGSPITDTGTVTISAASGQTANSVLATPDGTTGAVSVRSLLNPDLPTVNAAHGGSGLASTTTYNLLATGTTSTGNFQQISPDTAGKFLKSNGVGALPTFQDLPPAVAHDILGPSHNNTATQPSFARGDLLSAQGAGTSVLSRLVLGTSGLPVVSNGTDVVYGQASLTAGVSGILPIANGGTNATSSSFSLNGAYYWDGTRLVTTATGGAGGKCLVSVDGGTPVWGSCAGSASTDWGFLSNPTQNMAVNVGTFTSIITASTGTSTSDIFTIKDTTGNTGTGHLAFFQSVGTSTIKPFAATAKGTANGIEMDNVGNLTPIGTGKISPRAADITGTLSYSQLALTGAILNADLAGSIAYSKLSLTGAILNADLAGSIAYSKLVLTGAVLNADLAGSIADTKLSTISTAGKVSDSALSSNVVLLNAANAFVPNSRSSGSSAYLSIATPSDTNLTVDTEAIGVRFITATRQHADGTTQAQQREVVYEAPTYSAAGTSIITNVATVNIDGAPIAGTNMTHTNKAALWVGNTTDGMLIPNQVNPFIFGVEAIKLGYADSTAGNIFQLAGVARNTGSAPVVGVGGFGFGNGASANAFGGNFVGYAEVNGANVQGAEIDSGNLVANASGGAHALVLAMYGGNGGTNYMQMQSGSASSEPNDGILFNSTTRTAVKSTGTMIRSTGTSTVTNGVDFSSGLTFTGSAFKSPGFAVGPLGQVTVPSSNGTSGVWSMDAGLNTALTIANNGNATPTGNTANFSGLILVMDTTAGESALFLTSSGVTNLISQTATGFSNTLGTASKANLYVDGSFIVHLENKRGSSHDFNLMTFRIRNF